MSRLKFLFLGDIHWGTVNVDKYLVELNLILSFIKLMSGRIDLLVIGGDYFDHRLNLNSKIALAAIGWFDQLYQTSIECGVKYIRFIKGTKEHDNDQLEVFRESYVKPDGIVKIYNTTTVETLDEHTCIFCPDEVMTTQEYYDEYLEMLMSNTIDIGFFHGNFNTVLPKIEQDRITSGNLPTMIYDYSLFSKIIKGPLISGHWHTPHHEGSLYYPGSFSRWVFGESEPKGFMYGVYDNRTETYFIRVIENTLCDIYDTITVTNDDVHTPAHFANLNEQIRSKLQETPNRRTHIRIMYLITNPEIDSSIELKIFQKQYVGNPNIKIDCKDLLKREMKKQKKEQQSIQMENYRYLFNENSKLAQKIQLFIRNKNNIDLDIGMISKYIDKYLEVGKGVE